MQHYFISTAPDDYSTLTASLLTFTANSGDGSITYTLPIVNDNLAEGDETFTVILALPSSINTCQDGGGITIGGISQAVVTILDDDCKKGSRVKFHDRIPCFVLNA